MIWYQKFEYAVSHWLQKATEHLIGCVLCSPGCFSLFRASALMDDNVMRKYATTSSNARHYIQFDQGNIDIYTCMIPFGNKKMKHRVFYVFTIYLTKLINPLIFLCQARIDGSVHYFYSKVTGWSTRRLLTP